MYYSKKKQCLNLILLLVFALIISGCSDYIKSNNQDVLFDKEDNNYNENYTENYPENNEEKPVIKKIQEGPVPSVHNLILPTGEPVQESEDSDESLPETVSTPILTPTMFPTLIPTKEPSPDPSPVPTKLPTPSPTVIPKSTAESQIDTLDTLIGKSKNYIVSNFGTPKAYEQSEYGFTWYVYHNNYANLLMIGIEDNTVVGIYTNSGNIKIKNINIGVSRDSVRKSLDNLFEGPLSSIKKDNTIYRLNRVDERDVYLMDCGYTTFFYDIENSFLLTAIQIIEYNTEQKFGKFPEPGTEISKSYERVAFYLINSIRIRMGYKPLIYDNNMGNLALEHSKDMVIRDFFSHTAPPLESNNPEDEGMGLVDRILDAGFLYFRCAENISDGYSSAIYAHESLMNSSGHRKNILKDVKNIGIGVYMDQGKIRMTQIFITYR